MRHILIAHLALLSSAAPALAHWGHVGELAGHGHGIAIGILAAAAAAAAAAAVAAMAAALAKPENSDDGDECDEEPIGVNGEKPA